MDHLILLANIGSDVAKMGQQTAETFGVDWPHLIAQIISFSIVAILLARFAYKPVLAVLAERRQRIAEGLANAERIKAELARTEAARLEDLEQANLQAHKLIEPARPAPAPVQEQETQKASATANASLEDAKQADDAD